jgi:hypothetical protein
MSLSDRVDGQPATARAQAYSFLPLGRRLENGSPLLYVRHAGLFNLQRRRGAHELDYGQQARTHEYDTGFTKLD